MVLGIADQGVVWVAPCLGDCCSACRVGGAVSLGLLTRASSEWRRVFGIGDQGPRSSASTGGQPAF